MHTTQALQIAQEVGDRRREIEWLGNLGCAYARQGNTTAAGEAIAAAEAIVQGNAEKSMMAKFLAQKATVHALSDAPDEVPSALSEAHAMFRELGDRYPEILRDLNEALAASKAMVDRRSLGDTSPLARVCNEVEQALAPVKTQGHA